MLFLYVANHIYSVGLRVARSDKKGNARALVRGMSNSSGSHVFFVYVLIIEYIRSQSGAIDK